MYGLLYWTLLWTNPFLPDPQHCTIWRDPPAPPRLHELMRFAGGRALACCVPKGTPFRLLKPLLGSPTAGSRRGGSNTRDLTYYEWGLSVEVDGTSGKVGHLDAFWFHPVSRLSLKPRWTLRKLESDLAAELPPGTPRQEVGRWLDDHEVSHTEDCTHASFETNDYDLGLARGFGLNHSVTFEYDGAGQLVRFRVEGWV
jgi:hypothetical protein